MELGRIGCFADQPKLSVMPFVVTRNWTPGPTTVKPRGAVMSTSAVALSTRNLLIGNHFAE